MKEKVYRELHMQLSWKVPEKMKENKKKKRSVF